MIAAALLHSALPLVSLLGPEPGSQKDFGAIVSVEGQLLSLHTSDRALSVSEHAGAKLPLHLTLNQFEPAAEVVLNRGSGAVASLVVLDVGRYSDAGPLLLW